MGMSTAGPVNRLWLLAEKCPCNNSFIKGRGWLENVPNFMKELIYLPKFLDDDVKQFAIFLMHLAQICTSMVRKENMPITKAVDIIKVCNRRCRWPITGPSHHDHWWALIMSELGISALVKASLKFGLHMILRQYCNIQFSWLAIVMDEHWTCKNSFCLLRICDADTT